MRPVVLALVGALLAGACADRPEARDVLGLWVQSDDDVLAADLELEVRFVRPVDANGCWSARPVGAGGAHRPVAWPPGTLLGMNAVVELPDGQVLRDGDVVVGTGGLLGPGDTDPFPPASIDPPDGCDVSAGYVVLDEVDEVRAADDG